MNIVLAHGILGFSRIDIAKRPFEYFNGIAEHLRKRFQAQVIAPGVDPTAGIAVRANLLRQRIQEALQRSPQEENALHPDEPIHIIGHSMGGLDARMLVSADPTIEARAGTRAPVKTVVTISTPHRGSPVADLVALKFLPRLPGILDILGHAERGLGEILGLLGISLDGLHDLTAESAAHFNVEHPPRPDVRYLSFAGRGRDGSQPTARFLLPFHAFIQASVRGREPNDGLVTVSSAQWGEFEPHTWPCDHADEIGHDLDKLLGPPPASILDAYAGIVARL